MVWASPPPPLSQLWETADECVATTAPADPRLLLCATEMAKLISYQASTLRACTGSVGSPAIGCAPRDLRGFGWGTEGGDPKQMGPT